MATETARSAVPADVSQHLTTEDRVGLLRAMLMMRGIEERAMMLYRQGKVPGSFYDGFGQEAVSAGPAWGMDAPHRLCGLHRGPPPPGWSSCPAPSPRTSSAACRPRASSPSTWDARVASRAAATATCTSV